MQETLAAAIIRLSEWDGSQPLLDCMCGSGTDPLRGAHGVLPHPRAVPARAVRLRVAARSRRALWQRVRTEADARIRPLPASLISGSDMSERTLNAARENLARLPHGDAVALDCRPFQHVRSFSGGVLVTNPPYGIRLGEIDDVQKLYGELGDFIKQRCTGSTAWIYMGDPSPAEVDRPEDESPHPAREREVRRRARAHRQLRREPQALLCGAQGAGGCRGRMTVKTLPSPACS
jgi:putative N6-adenine-specific DNA methylase